MMFKTNKEKAKSGSDKALGMFTLAVEQLENSNTLATSTIEENNKKIKELTDEVSEMSTLNQKNSLIISNIKKMLGEDLVIAESLVEEFEDIKKDLDSAE